jgi:hypothetical protein
LKHRVHSANEPNVQLLTVRFVTERSGHQVQADRLPALRIGARRIGGLCLRRLVECRVVR